MTPEAIVRVIAERDNAQTIIMQGCGDCDPCIGGREDICAVGPIEIDATPDYLSSRDALFPVIGKLSNDESLRLSAILWEEWESQLDGRLEVIMLMKNESFEIWLLTLPPETLAPLVARAIVESK